MRRGETCSSTPYRYFVTHELSQGETAVHPVRARVGTERLVYAEGDSA